MDNLKTSYLADVAVALDAANTYYQTENESPMTDAEYDLLLVRLTKLGEANNWTEHEQLLAVAAGTAPIEEDKKVTHRARALSLNKAQDEEELTKFLEKMVAYGLEHDEAIDLDVEPKLDGLAFIVTYVDGELEIVATRGDSRVGENLTEKVKTVAIKGLPHKIDYEGVLEIRGELFMTLSDFAAANTYRDKVFLEEQERKHTAKVASFRLKNPGRALPKDLAEFSPVARKQEKHPRNTVSGAIMSKNASRLDGVVITLGTYDVIPVTGVLTEEVSYRKVMEFAASQGFLTASSLVEGVMDASLTPYEQVVQFGAVRDKLDVPTDGVVVKVDSLPLRELIGSGEKHPRWAVAYKYEAKIEETTLREIVRNVGRTGAITYVAVFDTVDLDAEVSNATVNNARFIANLDLRIGDRILVRKANDIIPEVVSVVFEAREGKSLVPYEAPTTCPKCAEDLDTTSSIIWRCHNPECALANRIIHAVSRNNLDIDGLSTSYIELLVDAGLIADVADVYGLTFEQLATLETAKTYTDTPDNQVLGRVGQRVPLGEKTASTLMAAIEKSKAQSLNRIISSLGIRFLGSTFGRRFADHFQSFDAFTAATVAELQQVDGVKDKAVDMRAGLDKLAPLLEKYRAVGFLNMVEVPKAASSDALAGESVVVTGAVPGFSTRDSVKELIMAHGGVAGSSVSSKTTILVAPEFERETSKAKKALALGITILTPEQFLSKLGV